MVLAVRTPDRLRAAALVTLAVNIVVILLGAFVRATGSGAGCGRSWPSCQGELIPGELEGATLVEFTHRAASGVALLMVLGLFLLVRRSESAPLRRAGLWSLVAIVGEALIGAGIVLFEWVADDASVARAVAVPLHLVNTLLLLAALTAVLVLADGRAVSRPRSEILRPLRWGVVAMLVVAATGAVAALADTLFPAESLAEGITADFGATANFLTRLRVLHPFVAVGAGVLLIWLVSRPAGLQPWRDSTPARLVVWLVVIQVAAGVLNVVLLVPVAMQLIHLLLADLLWIAFVWFALEAMTQRSAATAS